jgi:hypothetical protein
MYRPRRSGGLPLGAGDYCDCNTGPAEEPHRITRGGWPEEPVATKRLGGSAGGLLDRGSIVRLRLPNILGHRPKDTVPGMLPPLPCQPQNFEDRRDFLDFHETTMLIRANGTARRRGRQRPRGSSLHASDLGYRCGTDRRNSRAPRTHSAAKTTQSAAVALETAGPGHSAANATITTSLNAKRQSAGDARSRWRGADCDIGRSPLRVVGPKCSRPVIIGEQFAIPPPINDGLQGACRVVLRQVILEFELKPCPRRLVIFPLVDHLA